MCTSARAHRPPAHLCTLAPAHARTLAPAHTRTLARAHLCLKPLEKPDRPGEHDHHRPGGSKPMCGHRVFLANEGECRRHDEHDGRLTDFDAEIEREK